MCFGLDVDFAELTKMPGGLVDSANPVPIPWNGFAPRSSMLLS